MSYVRRTDANHAEIAGALQAAGYYVFDTHCLGKGFPDLLCVSKSHIPVLLEVKTDAGKLNARERQFFAEYPGPHRVVCSPEQAILTMEIYDEMEIWG